MQVQHEAQLLETINAEPTVNVKSTLDVYTLSQSFPHPIECLACNPVESQIAVHVSNPNQVALIDTRTPHKRDKFPLKPCDKTYSRLSFTLKGLEFSPDGTRIAVGQTDCIIYIYRLPNPQPSMVSSKNPTSGKPTITGKFMCSSPITCLVWIEWGIVFGTQDGKVKLISTPKASNPPDNQTFSSASTKVIGLYSSPTNSMPISLSYKSPHLAVGFTDGSVIISTVSIEPSNSVIETSRSESPTSLVVSRRGSSQQQTSQVVSVEHSCPPVCLTMMPSNILCCAGADGRLAMHSIRLERSSPSSSSRLQQSLTAARIQNIELKESVESMDYSALNEILALATSRRIMFIKYDKESAQWQQQPSFIELRNQLIVISSLVWSKDGAQLIAGTSGGSVELFKCSWNKQSISEELDICHIAKNRIRITDRARNLLATYKTQYDIKQINLLHNGRNVIIWTSNSLLLAHLGQAGAQSEIQWMSNREKGNTKFSFEHQDFVLIYNSFNRELKIVRLGEDKIAQTVQVDTAFKPQTISVRRYPARFRASSVLPISKQMNRRSSSTTKDESQHAILSGNLSSENQSKSAKPDIDTDEYYSSVTERFAYVLDSSLLNVINLKDLSKELNYRHQEVICWVKLSHTGNLLLFKDSLNMLYLIDLQQTDGNLGKAEPKKMSPLLERCEFASWLEQTDILVAQSEYRIFIWYNIKEMQDKVSYDSRSFNCSSIPPIIDLSFAGERANRVPYPVVNGLNSSEYKIHLSNRNVLDLDEVKVKFYTEILTATSNQLEAAFEVLESYQNDKENVKSLRNLWSKLGWMAIEQADCRIAMHAFGRLQHKSMVKFLEQCLAKPSEEQRWRLAMLCGNWTEFERFSEPEQIIVTYKRLNRWSQLIDYLNRTQQFRQRDLAEQEYLRWLIARGRYSEAARIQAKMGDLSEALEMLMKNKLYVEGADLLVENFQKSPLREKSKCSIEQKLSLQLEQATKDLKDRLVGSGNFKNAAMLSDKVLGEDKTALELYLRGCDFKAALELAKRVDSNRIVEIENLFGQYLMKEYSDSRLSRREALKAIDHFVAADELTGALEAAITLKEFHRAHELLQQINSGDLSESTATKLKDCSMLVAEHFIAANETKDAVEVLLIGQHYKQVVDLYLKLGNFEEAFKVSSESIHKDRAEAEAEFNLIAENMIASGSLQEAEEIYLLLDKPDLAMEMYRRSKKYTKMLDIVKRFFPDLLESNLLMLAKESEAEGRLDEAERYLLEASQSEWTNVVRMYRMANKWSEAYRVALKYCYSRRDPLLVQLAYWWAKSLIKDGDIARACQLIDELEVADEVLDFACENRNFQLAIDLCSKSGDQERNDKRRVISKRYAAYLEREHKFGKAEEVLVAEQLLREAIHMYLDNGMYADALRVVEERLSVADETNQTANNPDKADLSKLLNETLVESANRLAAEVGSKPRQGLQLNGNAQSRSAEDKLTQAQQLYLRAGRPDLVVELYKNREMWQEAVQVAQRFAPQLVESVELALDAKAGEDLASIVGSLRDDNNARALFDPSRRRSDGGRAINGMQELNSPPPTGREVANDRISSQAGVSTKSNDVRETKAALGKFLKTLIEGNGELDSASDSGGLSLVERLEFSTNALVDLPRGSQVEQSVVAAQHVILEADKLFQSCRWGRWPISAAETDDEARGSALRGDLLIWCRTRDLLGMSVKRLEQSCPDSSRPEAEMQPVLAQLRRRLLASHFIALHGYLAHQLLVNNLAAQSYNLRQSHLPLGEPSPAKMERLAAISLSHSGGGGEERGALDRSILDLIGRLSLSSLRYTDFMNLSNAFYVAGLWLIAARRPEEARFIWSRLVELMESGSLASKEADRDQLNRADIPLDVAPPGGNLRLQFEGVLSVEQLGEIRRWLLGSLISEKDNQRGSNGLSLDDRGLWASALRVGAKKQPLRACLVCGYPVFTGDPDQLTLKEIPGAGPIYQVHLSEWRRLPLMNSGAGLGRASAAARSDRYGGDGLRLSQISDFISWLSGGSSEVLEPHQINRAITKPGEPD